MQCLVDRKEMRQVVALGVDEVLIQITWVFPQDASMVKYRQLNVSGKSADPKPPHRRRRQAVRQDLLRELADRDPVLVLALVDPLLNGMAGGFTSGVEYLVGEGAEGPLSGPSDPLAASTMPEWPDRYSIARRAWAAAFP